MDEGGHVYACRFSAAALYGMREIDMMEGVKPINPLDVLDAVLTARRQSALIMQTWTSEPVSTRPAVPLRGGVVATRPPVPPFDRAAALQKVQAAENAWNTRDPERVAAAYTLDSVWRNRDTFITGRASIVEFLQSKWQRELDYALRKSLWAFTADRIAVRFQYESHDRGWELVSQLRQRALGVRRRGPDAPPRGEHQRRADHRDRAADLRSLARSRNTASTSR